MKERDELASTDQTEEHKPKTPISRETPVEQAMLAFLANGNSFGSSGGWTGAIPAADSSGEGSGAIPNQIGRYQVLGELGGGTFGVVLRAYDPTLDQIRALKLPRPETLVSKQARSRFLDEPRALGQLDHPNIVRVFDADEVGEFCFMVMECCDGGSLASWLKSRALDDPIPIAWAVDLVARMADGVAHAHHRKIYHRDLKPGNILLVREAGNTNPPRFCPKVSDFGMAKILDRLDGGGYTATGAMLGTLAYMAPEQARGDKKELGPQADVYALGVILYELLARHLPYPPDLSRAELLDHVLNVEPTPLRIHRANVPRDLVTICHKCLSKLPTDRYATAVALAEDLRRFLRGEPILGRLPSLHQRVARAIRTRTSRASLLFLTGTVCVAGAFTWEFHERNAAAYWLTRLGACSIPEMSSLIQESNSRYSRVAKGVKQLFETGQPSSRLAAALVLAPLDPTCGDYVIERLLDVPPADLVPLLQAVGDRVPGLPARLTASMAATFEADSNRREATDHRRANAAAALILLGSDSGLDLLDFQADPQARTFLIHAMAGYGISPETILNHLARESQPKDGSRRALIQSLGEMPTNSWTEPLRQRAVATVSNLFVDDQDAGVHASAKWFLRSWNYDDAIKTMEVHLAGLNRYDDGFRWRVTRSGLTFVLVETPERLVEIADCEITVGLFQKIIATLLDPAVKPRINITKLQNSDEMSPTLDCPVNSINFHIAAGFCYALTILEGLLPDDQVYGQVGKNVWVAAPDEHDRHGFRLMTDREYDLACRAETTTSRFYGDSVAMLAKYAWHNPVGNQRAQPVGRLKPNDFGFFDLLGNVNELADWTINKTRLQETVCGGQCSMSNAVNVVVSTKETPLVDNQDPPSLSSVGFRVARTIRPRS